MSALIAGVANGTVLCRRCENDGEINAFGKDLMLWQNYSAVSKIVKTEGCPLEVFATM